MPNDDLQAKREKARLAMESEEYVLHRRAKVEELSAKREKARLAMEGYERRSRREKREFELTESAKRQQEIVQAEIRSAEKIATEKEAAVRAAQAKVEAEDRAREEHIKQVKQSHELIEELKTSTRDNLSPIRTLKGDLAQAVKSEQLSFSKIAIKQQEGNRLLEQTRKDGSRKWLSVIIATVFILVGGAAGYYFYTNTPATPNTPPPAVIPPPLIPASASREFDFTAATASDISESLRAIRLNMPGQPGALTHLHPTISRDNAAVGLSLKEFNSITGINLPEELLQFLDVRYMLGIVHGQNGGNVFLVFRTNYFENAAYSMNRNENSIAGNLYGLLVGTTPPKGFLTTTFKDKTIKNIDARLMRDAAGNTIYLYGFLDRNTLVITTSEESFASIVGVYNTPTPAGQ